jgi:hypothetical protein
MAIKIRENPKIKGIKVLHSEHEISQFADDTSVILDGSEESLNETPLAYSLSLYEKTQINSLLIDCRFNVVIKRFNPFLNRFSKIEFFFKCY